jgi:hypothetical protein
MNEKIDDIHLALTESIGTDVTVCACIDGESIVRTGELEFTIQESDGDWRYNVCGIEFVCDDVHLAEEAGDTIAFYI